MSMELTWPEAVLGIAGLAAFCFVAFLLLLDIEWRSK